MIKRLLVSGLVSLLGCQQNNTPLSDPPKQKAVMYQNERLLNWHYKYDKNWNALLSLEGKEATTEDKVEYIYLKRMMIDLGETKNNFSDMVKYLDIMEKEINEYAMKLSRELSSNKP
jgi:ABC-type taurine transport system ATPase subunit